MATNSFLSGCARTLSLAERVAGRLAEFDIGARQILVQATDLTLLPDLVNGAWRSGWTVALLNDEAPAHQHDQIVQQLSPCLVVRLEDDTRATITVAGTEQNFFSWLKGPRVDVPTFYPWGESECALILFTSGSTGQPKGVCHSLGNLQRSAALFAECFSLSKQQTLFCLAPIHTISGFRSLVLSLSGTCRVVHLGDDPFLTLLSRIGEAESAAVLCGPVFIRQLAAYGEHYGERLRPLLLNLRSIFCAGSELDQRDQELVQVNLGIPVLNYYGLTETAGLVLAERPGLQFPGCLPPPCPGVEVELRQRDDEELFELIIHAPNIFLGYLGYPLKRRLNFPTGDLVRKSADGTLVLQGRADGMVKGISTQWLHPQMLERWLRARLPGIDVLVGAIAVAGGYGLEVTFDHTDDLKFAELEQMIVADLGEDYRPRSWTRQQIKRNPLGKIAAEPHNQ